MAPRLLVITLAPLLASATAFAQAPGEVDPSYAQPPPSSNPCATSAISPMAQRFAIGVSFGGMGVHPDADAAPTAGDDEDARFRIAELAFRYRASRRIELELSLGGGRQTIEGADGEEDGELAMGNLTFGARYRFLPERKWNWWVMAGIGGTIIAPHESSEEERDAATRPHGVLGVGVERRFRRFALQAELRMVGIGKRDDAQDGAVPPPDKPQTEPGMDPRPALLPPQTFAHAQELSGGMFTLGASYYF